MTYVYPLLYPEIHIMFSILYYIYKKLVTHTYIYILYIYIFLHNIVDWKHPAPVDMLNIPLFLGFYTSQVVVWDFFHQGINSINPCFWTNSFFNPLELISWPNLPWWIAQVNFKVPTVTTSCHPSPSRRRIRQEFQERTKNGGFPKAPDFRQFFSGGLSLT